MLTKHSGILRTYRPERDGKPAFGFIHSPVEKINGVDTISIFYFNPGDVVEGLPVVGVRCEFFATGLPEPGRQYSHAVSIIFEKFPKADGGRPTTIDVIDAGTRDGSVSR